VDKREIAALLLVILILLGLPAATLGYQRWLRPATADARVIDIDMTMPETGGFHTDAIEVNVGEPIILRFSALDVTHGVAIGPGLGIDLGPIDPGKVKEVTLTFDHPGTYTYYCTTWCSTNHWRMRGVIRVTEPGVMPEPQRDPVIEALIAEGVDIDAAVQMNDHEMAADPTMDLTPSISRGEQLALIIPADLRDETWRFSHSPNEAVDRLREVNPEAAEQDLVDVIAYLWKPDLSPEELEEALYLYNQNCAACHGPTGQGDGLVSGQTAAIPAVFADFGYMFDRRSDVLYAKIRRGGMGTDMPNFGTLFTQDETRLLVKYLWSLMETTSH
jgi:mono/diheme cytochrome c family protein/plastocyanin